MEINFPPRVSLARTPTPLAPMRRFSAAVGRDVWIKRDDLTGVALSGNKVRKLEFLVAEAEAAGARLLVTCGGVNSNHARATAVAAAQRGLCSHLVLRGEDRDPPRGNLLLSKVVGARITYITRDQWDDRDAIMAQIADQSAEPSYVIPEGGSNALGSLGYARAIDELLTSLVFKQHPSTQIVSATGSGGTTAGMALGLAAADRTDIELYSVAVCNDAEYFNERVERIIAEAVEREFVSREVASRARWTIVEGFRGDGYGQTNNREMKDHIALARDEGLFVDPVYSGKALRAIREGGVPDAARTLFWHTGGIFELFAFAEDVAAAL